MTDKKCTWSQHLKWFLERRADPANKDLTDLEISQQYTAENMTVVEDNPSYKGVYPDKIFVECLDRVMGDTATIEEKPVSLIVQLRLEAWKFSRDSKIGIDQPSAILMHPQSFGELFNDIQNVPGLESVDLSDCHAGYQFYGIPIYRTTDVETFKVL